MIGIYSRIKTPLILIILILFAFLMVGCASNLTTVVPMPPEKYEKLGYATGTAAGALCSPLGGTIYYFVPIMLNDRVERAYANALSSVPGATHLINVTYEEDWYWWLLGESRHVTISGEAVMEVK